MLQRIQPHNYNAVKVHPSGQLKDETYELP